MQWILYWLVPQILLGVFAWKFYVAAGRKSWEAFVPAYNVFILLKIIERPWWWFFLLITPVVGNIMAMVMVYELFHVFGHSKLKHTFFTIITLGLYLAYFNYTEKLTYKGRDIKTIRQHVSEFGAAILFAIVAATLIRALTFEAFTIPTPSMEKSLMVGDFLFVSKMQYGSRPPMTPLSLPLVHNRVPVLNVKSYSDAIQLPYWRFPKISEVQPNDPVVFNYPMEDQHPVDKREHYVKRCMAVPGDTLQIIDRQVYIDGEPLAFPDRARPQFQYIIQSKQALSPDFLKKNYDVNYLFGEDLLNPNNVQDVQGGGSVQTGFAYKITLAEDKVEDLQKLPFIKSVEPLNYKTKFSDYSEDLSPVLRQFYIDNSKIFESSDVFPNSPHGELVVQWTRDNYGPIYMPKAGDKVTLNKLNLALYRRAIEIYEGNTLEIRENDGIYINGEKTDTYTFKQGYYWMMGDNRHNSLDSRYWGYVPEDHIVGKPVFIWMSFDKYAEGLFNKIRTNRVFTLVNGEGERKSFFWPFAILVAAYMIGRNLMKKRKAKKAA